MKKSLYVKQTESTNALCWDMNREKALPEGFVVYTDFQSAGKGQPGNSWESAEGKNLLFSMVLHPLHVPMNELFILSELVSVAIKRALDMYSPDITVKWPNDIYTGDKKLAGILIENSLQGTKIKTVVVGIGLNVNQKEFVSDAPNPVSLMQIIGKRQNRKEILRSICENIMDLYVGLDKNQIRKEYAASLYRKEAFYPFQTGDESFQARIIEVHPDGQLELETANGERKGFYFKEVKFVV